MLAAQKQTRCAMMLTSTTSWKELWTKIRQKNWHKNSRNHLHIICDCLVHWIFTLRKRKIIKNYICPNSKSCLCSLAKAKSPRNELWSKFLASFPRKIFSFCPRKGLWISFLESGSPTCGRTVCEFSGPFFKSQISQPSNFKDNSSNLLDQLRRQILHKSDTKAIF